MDPYYYVELSRKVGYPSLLASSSREINSRMPEYSASHISEILDGIGVARVLILGYSYKANVGDTRETPVRDLSMYLNDEGHYIMIHDSMVGEEEVPEWVEYVSEPTKCGWVGGLAIIPEYEFQTRISEEMMSNMNKYRIAMDEDPPGKDGNDGLVLSWCWV